MKYRVIWSDLSETEIEAETIELLFNRINDIIEDGAETLEVMDIYDNGRNIIFSREKL